MNERHGETCSRIGEVGGGGVAGESVLSRKRQQELREELKL